MTKKKLQKSTILTVKEQSDIVDAIYRFGVKTETTANCWETGKKIEAFYYKATEKQKRIHKSKMLKGSIYTLRDEFEADFARWVMNGWELQQLDESFFNLPGNDEKGVKLETVRNALWQNIEPVLINAGFAASKPPEQNIGSNIEPPKELTTPEAKEILKKAVGAELCEQQGDFYKWNRWKPQLALFAELMGKEVGVKNKWKPFETLFQVKGLADVRSKSINIMGKVKGQDEIYDLFE